jgi:hypothetical protein
MFTCLRHMTCQLFVRHSELKADNGVLQVAHCLNAAPQLETLHLNVSAIFLAVACLCLLFYSDRLIANF